NFIGVPLAGFESFKAFMASGSAEPGSFLMNALREPVNTPVYFLIAAGLIMVMTLRFSKKAKSVTATTIDLSRQGEGKERFASSSLARFIVRRSVEFSNGVNKVTPRKITSYISHRFDEDQNPDDGKEKLAFDMVRASVNLVVASILIAIGTSLKLPLSTTYVTFMVAMGTSLADGAWGRESAVYRITGVLTVVGGWFFTAFSAFCAAFLIATIIFFGKMPIILLLIALSIYILLRTHAFHKKKAEKEERLDSEIITASYQVLKSCDDEVKSTVIKVSKILYLTYNSFLKEKHKQKKKLQKETKHLGKDVKKIRENIHVTLKKFEESEIESGHFYVQVIDYLKEMTNSLRHIVEPAFVHLDNNHPLDKEQTAVFSEFNNKTNEFFNYILNLLKNRNFDTLDELVSRRDEISNMINEIIRNRIKILKKTQKGAKVSVTYIEMLTETKNLLLHVVQLVKAEGSLLQSFSSPS
ncbi:MAG: inorganic phosphate transporter, partial [Bacteroidales bacterium]|nr:inorganic phosphate transporter [Bacteroidales bacterium]